MGSDMRRAAFIYLLILGSSLLAGCASDSESAATPTPASTFTFTSTPTSTPTDTPQPTATVTTLPATPTPVPSATPVATPSPTWTSTATNTPPSTATATATETPTEAATATATATAIAPVDVAQTLFDELDAVGIGRYLGRDVPEPTLESNWLRYDFAPSDDGPICLYGTPYRVYVRPGTSDNVLFYLEGGGACWNNENCWGNTRAKIDAAPLLPLAVLRGGIFATSPQFNPLAGWTVVYVPYCDGSVFTGDNVADYERGTVWHRGLSNLTTGVDVMKSLYPNPSRIVVSGSSAGGYGTFTGYAVTRLAYPTTEILVINDSGPGLQNNNDPQALADRRENWRFEQFRPAACTDCVTQPAFLTPWAMQYDPRLRGGFFASLQDEVIRGFLDMSGPQFEQLLLDATDQVVAKNPDRVKRFFVAGEFHTILLGGGLGSSGIAVDYRSLKINDTTLPQWIDDLVSGDPAWSDLVQGR